MIQTAVVVLVVVAAAAYAGWSLFLRGFLARRRKTAAECGPDCACGD